MRWFVEKERVEVADIGVPARFLRYLDRGEGVAAELEAPYRFTSYDTLYRSLLGAFGRENYHLGEEVVAVEQSDRGATARLASGEAREGDLVIWADGIRSAGRRQLVPEAESRYAGYVAWRGTVSPADLTDSTLAALSDAITYCVLPHSHLLTYQIPTSEGSQLNWLWYRNVSEGTDLQAVMTDRAGATREVAVPPGAVGQGPLAELRESAGAVLPPPLVEVVSVTADPFLQAIFDIEVPRMAFGRTCLIGDAAFSLRPHVAAGSAKAAEDGYRLGQAVRQAGGDVTRALELWETPQLELARSVLVRTREAGRRSQFDGSWRVGDPLPFGLYEEGDSLMPTSPR